MTQPKTPRTFEPPGLAPKRYQVEMDSSEDEFEELVNQTQDFKKWTKIKEQAEQGKLKNIRVQETLYHHMTKSGNE